VVTAFDSTEPQSRPARTAEDLPAPGHALVGHAAGLSEGTVGENRPDTASNRDRYRQEQRDHLSGGLFFFPECPRASASESPRCSFLKVNPF
jgi:hypothetical protein